jgi:hypothetical protein
MRRVMARKVRGRFITQSDKLQFLACCLRASETDDSTEPDCLTARICNQIHHGRLVTEVVCAGVGVDDLARATRFVFGC